MIHHKTAENTSTNTTISDLQQLLLSPGPTDAGAENVNEETQHNKQSANTNHSNI